jgi:hypothetical protein
MALDVAVTSRTKRCPSALGAWGEWQTQQGLYNGGGQVGRWHGGRNMVEHLGDLIGAQMTQMTQMICPVPSSFFFDSTGREPRPK